ncbi:hypothetical protein E2C01_062779 [Portunus trituberculatus]|uniref:Uncharacterized protein n=1 Tax=Portunus trituberculatus TaxID=210409 RepID=A0A5B7HH04_PORTR|nr:hypothetical protein [Portunus trituberculatus]
MVPLYHGDTQT